jgi:carbon-monoxide dehydrogenase medium subunit
MTQYITATTINEALDALRVHAGEVAVLAGGTDQFAVGMPPVVVDITAIVATRQLNEDNNTLLIGACITHAEATASPLIQNKATALAEACGQVGSPQIRNMGTLGGNVVNAAPAADAAVALVALGAHASVLNIHTGWSELPVEDLYLNFNQSTLNSAESIIIKFTMPRQSAGEGSAFVRLSPRRALSLPLLSAAVRLRLVEGKINDVRIVVAPVRPAPTRMLRTEEALLGQPMTRDVLRLVRETIPVEMEARGSKNRCSREYRMSLAAILVERALQAAAERAGWKAGEYHG